MILKKSVTSLTIAAGIALANMGWAADPKPGGTRGSR